MQNLIKVCITIFNFTCNQCYNQWFLNYFFSDKTLSTWRRKKQEISIGYKINFFILGLFFIINITNHIPIPISVKIPGWYNPSLVIAGYLHLPGMFQSSRRYQLFVKRLSSEGLTVTPSSIEIIRKRNTKQNPCDENTSEYDYHQIQGIFDRFGCIPYYFN